MDYTMAAKCCDESMCKNTRSNITRVTIISKENKSKVKKYAENMPGMGGLPLIPILMVTISIIHAVDGKKK